MTTTTQLPLPAELPTTATTPVGDYPTHAAAQQAVDYLPYHGFPVQHVTIVGVDLRLVETVTGRLTTARAAASGAAAGARYHLTASAEHADEANWLLLQHTWRTLCPLSGYPQAPPRTVKGRTRS